MTQKLKIPFFALDRQFKRYKNEFLSIVEKVFSTGKVLQGETVTELEKKIATLCNRKYAIAVGSCTDALAYALISCGIKPGDEVLVTSLSFIASASPIIRVGGKPVFVDIEPDYYMMDIKDAEKKISSKTKFLIAVHLFGQCLNMKEIELFAGKHNITIIEDAAQALGSFYNRRPAGHMGTVSCVSFDPTKVVGSFGSGGMLMTDSNEIAEKSIQLRYHGKDSKTSQYVRLGYNSQLSSEHAALLSFKMDHLSEWIKKRKNIAETYIRELQNIEEIILPRIRPGSTHNWHKFVIRIKNRDHLKRFLEDNGIQTMVHYPVPLYKIPYIANRLSRKVSLPVVEKICSEVISLPIYPELTKKEISYTINIIKKFFD